LEASSRSGKRFDDEGDAAEGVATGFDGAVDERVRPITAVVDLVSADSFSFGEAEVEEEFVDFFEVGVGVIDVGGADEADFLDWRVGRGHGVGYP
jgi:hypothetical protein